MKIMKYQNYEIGLTRMGKEFINVWIVSKDSIGRSYGSKHKISRLLYENESWMDFLIQEHEVMKSKAE
jgi:hypothetical protein